MSKIGELTKRLFPTGYAHRTITGSVKDKLFESLAVSEQQLYVDANSILDSMLPDNANFTANDAARLEEYYGIITNPLVSLQDRKDAIIRKMNHPGDILARQSAGYMQQQLQLAGFKVYVHETNSSIETLGGSGLSVQAGDAQAGETQFGHIMYDDKIANSLYASIDKLYLEDSLNRNTFVIGDITLGSYANVDVNRKLEFRQLVLRLKPVPTVGYLLINYV